MFICFRLGRCMVNTLPEKVDEGFHKNCYPVYSLELETPVVEEPVAKWQCQRSKFMGGYIETPMTCVIVCLFLTLKWVVVPCNFVTFSSAFAHVTLMNASTEHVSLVFVFLMHAHMLRMERSVTANI